jgi:hypothetical protein
MSSIPVIDEMDTDMESAVMEEGGRKRAFGTAAGRGVDHDAMTAKYTRRGWSTHPRGSTDTSDDKVSAKVTLDDIISALGRSRYEAMKTIVEMACKSGDDGHADALVERIWGPYLGLEGVENLVMTPDAFMAALRTRADVLHADRESLIDTATYTINTHPLDSPIPGIEPANEAEAMQVKFTRVTHWALSSATTRMQVYDDTVQNFTLNRRILAIGPAANRVAFVVGAGAPRLLFWTFGESGWPAIHLVESRTEMPPPTEVDKDDWNDWCAKRKAAQAAQIRYDAVTSASNASYGEDGVPEDVAIGIEAARAHNNLCASACAESIPREYREKCYQWSDAVELAITHEDEGAWFEDDSLFVLFSANRGVGGAIAPGSAGGMLIADFGMGPIGGASNKINGHPTIWVSNELPWMRTASGEREVGRVLPLAWAATRVTYGDNETLIGIAAVAKGQLWWGEIRSGDKTPVFTWTPVYTTLDVMWLVTAMHIIPLPWYGGIGILLGGQHGLFARVVLYVTGASRVLADGTTETAQILCGYVATADIGLDPIKAWQSQGPIAREHAEEVQSELRKEAETRARVRKTRETVLREEIAAVHKGVDHDMVTDVVDDTPYIDADHPEAPSAEELSTAVASERDIVAELPDASGHTADDDIREREEREMESMLRADDANRFRMFEEVAGESGASAGGGAVDVEDGSGDDITDDESDMGRGEGMDDATKDALMTSLAPNPDDDSGTATTKALARISLGDKEDTDGLAQLMATLTVNGTRDRKKIQRIMMAHLDGSDHELLSTIKTVDDVEGVVKQMIAQATDTSRPIDTSDAAITKLATRAAEVAGDPLGDDSGACVLSITRCPMAVPNPNMNGATIGRFVITSGKRVVEVEWRTPPEVSFTTLSNMPYDDRNTTVIASPLITTQILSHCGDPVFAGISANTSVPGAEVSGVAIVGASSGLFALYPYTSRGTLMGSVGAGFSKLAYDVPDPESRKERDAGVDISVPMPLHPLLPMQPVMGCRPTRIFIRLANNRLAVMHRVNKRRHFAAMLAPTSVDRVDSAQRVAVIVRHGDITTRRLRASIMRRVGENPSVLTGAWWRLVTRHYSARSKWVPIVAEMRLPSAAPPPLCVSSDGDGDGIMLGPGESADASADSDTIESKEEDVMMDIDE